MSTTTSRLGLTKPVGSETYSLNVWNNNSDLIDNKVALLGKKVSITLPTASWVGSASPWSQVITITGTNVNTKVDLCPDATTVTQMLADKTSSLFIENENGTLTAVAVGKGKPSVDLTVQAICQDID